jgi:RNA polymerase-binding transcription factor DksA
MQNLSEIREQLERDLQERQARIEKIDNRLRQPGLEDWEEQATQRENDEVLESLGKQTVEEIAQIKLALDRIERGTYGTCARCGRPINMERLRAMPFATSCIRCA